MEKKYQVIDVQNFNLKNYSNKCNHNEITKDKGKKILKKNKKEMFELQNMLYAHDKYSVLLIFQAMDAAGKDSAIKHVMSGLNPQGTQVASFKQPSGEELDHDYLWRINKKLPERGRIGIFNRSYYEEVLVVKVHNLINKQKLPQEMIVDNIWEKRYSQIRNYEEYLYENGIIPIKFFLNVSKEEQKKRFLERIDNQSKNWKFSKGDLAERKLWDKYQNAYEEAIKNTSTKEAPWYVIPADQKWYARTIISNVIINTLKNLNINYPELPKSQIDELTSCKDMLLNE